MTINIFDTQNEYDLIYADPPWKQSKGGKKNARPKTSGVALDYPVISLEEIKKHLQEATKLTTDNSILFL